MSGDSVPRTDVPGCFLTMPEIYTVDKTDRPVYGVDMTRLDLPVPRGFAGFLALFMATYFATDNFGGDSVLRLDNPFLVPDLLIVALAGTAAVLPRCLARPALLFALTWSAAVWTVSLTHLLVAGETGRGLGHLLLILPAVLAAGLVTVTDPERLVARFRPTERT